MKKMRGLVFIYSALTVLTFALADSQVQWPAPVLEDSNTEQDQRAYGTGKIYPFTRWLETEKSKRPEISDPVEKVYRFLELHTEDIPIKSPRGEFLLKSEKKNSMSAMVTFQQLYKGIPVHAWGRFYFNRLGELERVYVTYYDIHNLATAPQIDSAAALRIALEDLGFCPKARVEGPTGPEILWSGSFQPYAPDKFYLIWSLRVFPRDTINQLFYWDYYVNALDGSILHKASGTANCYSFERPYLPGELIDPPRSANLVEEAYKLFELNPDYFHMKNPRKELVYKSGSCGCFGCSFSFKQVHSGIEILNSGITVQGHGLKAVHGTYCNDISLSTTPQIDSTNAFNLALKNLRLSALDQKYCSKLFPSQLSIWRDQYDRFHLIWIIWVKYEFLPDHVWEFYIDAHEGEVLSKTEYVGSKSNAIKPGVYGDIDPSALGLPVEQTEDGGNKIKTENGSTKGSKPISETAKCYTFDGPVRLKEMVQPSKASPAEIAYKLFELNLDRFHIKNPREDLVLKLVHLDDIVSTIAFKQAHEGVDLLNSNISVTITQTGTINTVYGTYCSDINLSTTPQIESASALTLTLNQLGFPAHSQQGYTSNAIPSRLAVWRDNKEVFHLIWVVWLRWEESLPDNFWEVYVDANEGTVLYKAHYLRQKHSSM